MTKEERHLWYDFLRTHPYKFYRQRRIQNYIVDFYCHDIRLVIELDGSQHYDEAAKIYDAKRTTILNQLGLTVIRFTNQQINTSFSDVCNAISQYINDYQTSKHTV